MVTAGANMAFMHAVFAITEPGDEIILHVPFYFNHEMAIQMAGCRAVRVATDDHYQLRPDALRRAITDRTRAIVTISPNNPSGACPERIVAAAGERDLPRRRHLPHVRRGLRVFHVRRGAALLAGVDSGGRRLHDFHVLVVEGVRFRRLAHWLCRVPDRISHRR